MDVTAIILAIITALLGGTNIVQLFNNRALRRKLEAEGDQEQIKSLRMIIDANVQEIARLQQRIDDYATRYDNLLSRYVDLQNEMFNLRKLIGK